MGYEAPKAVRNVIVAVTLVAVGVGGHAWWSDRKNDRTESLSGISMAGNVRILSGEDGRNYLREQQARDRVAAEARRRAADAARLEQQSARDAAEQEMQALLKPIPAYIVKNVQENGYKYFKNDLPFNLDYKICRAHSEDDSETYFIIISGNGESIFVHNFNDRITGGKDSQKKAIFDGKNYDQFILSAEEPVEDIMDIKITATSENRTSTLQTTFQKFGSCENKTHAMD